MASTNIMNDFPLSQKRHVAPQSNLGPGLTPQQEHSNGIPHLTRSRVAHDGAEMAEDPNMWVTQQAKERQAQETPMMSTYQAMQAGASLDAKKRTGKKCFNPNAIPGASPLHGGAGFGMASGLRADPLTALEMGTTKQSPHLPGYTGHIPRTAAPTDAAPTRSNDKSLIIENYKPYGMGYTGRRS